MSPSSDPRDATYVFRQAVIITWINDREGWNAIFIEDDHNGHQSVYFPTSEAAIAWGKARCCVVRLVDPDTGEPSYV